MLVLSRPVPSRPVLTTMATTTTVTNMTTITTLITMTTMTMATMRKLEVVHKEVGGYLTIRCVRIAASIALSDNHES